jgi:N-methylhydantoinase B
MRGMEKTTPKVEPFLFALLAHRFDFVTRQMTNTLLRSARSGVVNTGHDFSCAIIDNRCRVISVADASPSHVGSAGLQIKVLKELFGEDIRPGDCFINACSYYGNTHNGDFTIVAPVFYKGECLFWTLARAHQADIGAPIPSSYLAFAKTVYEEGLQLPCVRIQRDYRDLEDIIRMCKISIRVSEQWYGDYLAQVGAVRIGERRLAEMCDKYGADIVKAFIDEWQEYGECRMIEEIKKLPHATLKREGYHDPVPGVAPEGIPVKVKIEIDPAEGYITVDLTENTMENIAGGFNLSQATLTAASLIGILHNIDPTVPHNEGAFSRIRIKAREGFVVGLPKYPVGTGLSTTNVADRLASVCQAAFAELGVPNGIAEGSTSMGAASVIVSGRDRRYGGAPYINQLVSLGGGPGLYGYDGWVTYGVASDNGVLHLDSVEVDEQKYPIIFDKRELAIDSGGDGQWRAPPATDITIGPQQDPAMFIYFNDGHDIPAQGVLGGDNAKPSDVWKHNLETGETINLPQMSEELLQPNERLVTHHATGGGYGDPLDRDPELVRWDVREGYISLERALEVYGVVLDTEPEQYAVIDEATAELRRKLKSVKREGGGDSDHTHLRRRGRHLY